MEEIQHSYDQQAYPKCLTELQQYNQFTSRNLQIKNFQSQRISKQLQKKAIFSEQRQSNFQRKADPLILKKMIKKAKTDRLVRNFCIKLKRKIPIYEPATLQFITQSKHDSYFACISQKKGYSMPSGHLVLHIMISLLLSALLSIFYTLALIFQQVQGSYILNVVQISATAFYLLEIFLGFITRNFQRGKAFVKVHEIATNYLKQQFCIDFLTFTVLVFSLISIQSDSVLQYCRLLFLVKLYNNLEKLQAIEKLFITNFNREQYWGLISVIFINFTFAHFLSILLNAMAFINSNNNWRISHGIEQAPWHQKYIWGYYWGTTIMLTVGFGDYVATSCQEAICLIFIEMFSCICLSYNINCVGNLINNLRVRSSEKNKNLKTFSLMSKENDLTNQLDTRINNYIQGSFQVKKEFNFTNEDALLESLPKNLKSEFLKESNKKIFNRLITLKDFTDKTKSILAENITKIIAHPQEVIQKKGELFKLLILQKGELGNIIKYADSKINGKTAGTLKIDDNEQPKLLSLDFIKNKRIDYQIKSLGYSVLYFIERENLLEILRQSSFDYEHYCMLRDREQYIINENQLYKCPDCRDQYHNMFKCPKLHYMPLAEHVVYRYNEAIKRIRQSRISVNRRRTKTNIKQLPNACFQMIEFRQKTFSHCNKMYPNYQQSFAHLTTLIKGSHTFGSEYTIEELDTKKELPALRRENQSQLYELIQLCLNKAEELFWTVECDAMYNWKYYFPINNPDNINIKLKRKHKRIC